MTDSRVGLLDTSTVILLDRIDDVAALPEISVISSVTLAELTIGPLLATTDADRVVRQAHLQQAEADFEVLPFDAAAARAFGRVSAALRSAGRKPTSRAFDALIAATALAHNLPLYTCNPADLADIDGLDVRAVPHPDH